jgi:hypothetical protein
MLRSMDDLKEYTIHATDGDVGHVKDLYFDDEGWAIRYFVVDTGGWLMGRKVLITPIAIGTPDWDKKTLPVGITMDQVKNSPAIDTEKPVSRQHENDYLGYYGYPIYWDGVGLWGQDFYPGMMLSGQTGYLKPSDSTIQDEVRRQAQSKENELRQNADSHLRSCREVIGYHILASDGEIGHVSAMLVDDESWAIRYFIVDTSNWWGGKKVLIAPLWLEDVQWPNRQVSVNLTRQAVKDAAPYEPGMTLERPQEIEMYRHYDRIGYWQHQEKNEEFDAYD